MMNTNESQMVASNGNICVVGSTDTLKHEEITDDNRSSIQLLLAGISAGAYMPCIYMTKGVKVDIKTLRRDFAKKHNVPPGLGVYATPNAYLNEETWRKIAPELCEGIHMMPVVRYYPDW